MPRGEIENKGEASPSSTLARSVPVPAPMPAPVPVLAPAPAPAVLSCCLPDPLPVCATAPQGCLCDALPRSLARSLSAPFPPENFFLILFKQLCVCALPARVDLVACLCRGLSATSAIVDLPGRRENTVRDSNALVYLAWVGWVYRASIRSTQDCSKPQISHWFPTSRVISKRSPCTNP